MIRMTSHQDTISVHCYHENQKKFLVQIKIHTVPTATIELMVARQHHTISCPRENIFLPGPVVVLVPVFVREERNKLEMA